MCEKCSTHGEMRNMPTYKIFAGEPDGKRSLRDLCVDGRTILKWILRKQCGRV
jgi:hypothetical protein